MSRAYCMCLSWAELGQIRQPSKSGLQRSDRSGPAGDTVERQEVQRTEPAGDFRVELVQAERTDGLVQVGADRGERTGDRCAAQGR